MMTLPKEKQVIYQRKGLPRNLPALVTMWILP
jgi:hypothetical protein